MEKFNYIGLYSGYWVVDYFGDLESYRAFEGVFYMGVEIKKKKANVYMSIACVICNKLVKVKRHIAIQRNTCNKIKVDGKLVKSPCEKEKARRYQKEYRERQKDGLKKKRIRKCSFADAMPIKKVIEKKTRYCLKCEEKFTAIGPFNRICEHCTQENKGYKD